MKFFDLEISTELSAFKTKKEAKAWAKEHRERIPGCKTTINKDDDGTYSVTLYK